jgi:hypothetical protein
MAREFIAIPNQIVEPGATVLFESDNYENGFVYHRDGSGLFRLASPSIIRRNYGGCCCCGMPVADYLVAFHGNVQIPEGGTVAQISLSIVTDGEVGAEVIILTTPTAVEIPENVGASIIDSVPWICRCSSVTIRNTGTEPVQIVNGNIILDFSGIRR